HDMKNPIKNLEHILSGSILTNLSAEEHKKVMSLLSEQLKYTGLTMENSILWVKQQMDGLKVNKTKFNLTELIQTNILLIKDSIDRKSIQIKLDLEKDFSVYGDRDVYNIVVRNLLSNAIKFSYPETGIIEIFQTLSEGKHWVSVKDNGQGIELDKLNMIFSQNESTFGTMQESGYGLGLKLVKSFLNNINEDIKVESTVDKGSVFSFTITKNTVN
ncbi:MAG: HAMP domain-containing histidine kinase, partial [Cyclobacteriaceae bacterium]|nr:HAMP domain-containing histidine kinase [Cyclobacteriaceae bacterium]